MSFNVKPQENFNADSNITIDSIGIAGIYSNSNKTFIYANGALTEFNTSLPSSMYSFDKIGDTYIAVQKSYAQYIYYSKDLKTWTGVSLGQFGLTPNLYDINISIANNTAFIIFYDMMNGSYILRSTNGSSWSVVHQFQGQVPTNIAYANGKYMFVQPNSYNGSTSSDGITWNANSVFVPHPYGSIYSIDNKYIVVGLDANNSVGYFSADGITWTYLGGGFYGKVKEFEGSAYMWGGNSQFSKLVWDAMTNIYTRSIAGIAGTGMSYSGYSFSISGNKIYYSSNQDAIRVSPIKYDGGMGMATYEVIYQYGGAFTTYNSTLTKTLKQFIQDLA